MSRVADMSLGPRLMGPMLIWMAVMAAGAVAAWFALGETQSIIRLAVGLSLPALASLLLVPVLHRIWAQILLLLLWTGFAVVATLLGGLYPIAVTFLCVPAVAMLFTRERVVEALVLAVLALIATLFSYSLVELGDSPLSDADTGFFGLLGTAGALAFVIAAMIAGTQTRPAGRVGATDDDLTWGDGVTGGLFEFDDADRLVRANAEGRAQFGLGERTARLRLSDLADLDGARIGLMDAARAARSVNTLTGATRIHLGSGTAPASTLDLHFTPTRHGGLILHALDRTDDAERLETLRRSQTVAEREGREKTLFFAGVSHELRTPLNAIIGFSDMMRSRLFGPLPGKYAEYADLIHDSGQYMLDLIGDVLDLSKVEAGKYTLVPDTFDVSDVVRSSVKMIRPVGDAAQVAIEIDLPDGEDLLITADRKAVRQMLLNLLSNAVKFSPKGGRIDVSAHAEGDDIVIAVRDRGPGMSELEIARIGQPYTQGASAKDVDARGSGLGLSLVRQLADLHGGRLDMHSSPDDGTDARLVLPALGRFD